MLSYVLYIVSQKIYGTCFIYIYDETQQSGAVHCVLGFVCLLSLKKKKEKKKKLFCTPKAEHILKFGGLKLQSFLE